MTRSLLIQHDVINATRPSVTSRRRVMTRSSLNLQCTISIYYLCAIMWILSTCRKDTPNHYQLCYTKYFALICACIYEHKHVCSYLLKNATLQCRQFRFEACAVELWYCIELTLIIMYEIITVISICFNID